jgi:hydroxypyruvate isomerase
MPRFEANIRWMFKEYGMPERFVQAARCGFKGVEHGDPYAWKAKDVARWLTDNGLVMVQILTPQDWAAGELGLVTMPGREADFRDAVKRGIDYAGEVGSKLLHPAIGGTPKGEARDRTWARAVANLCYACDEGKKAGLTLAIEPVCSARFPEFFIHTLDDGIQLIKDVGRDNLKLCFDTYHVQMEEGALSANLERTWPWIGHLQLGNPPDRHEPGVGELNLQYYFDMVDKKGWKGWIGCEYVPSTHTLDSLGWGAAYGIKKPT